MSAAPLSAHALLMLRRIVISPVPRINVNPGLANKLVNEGLAAVVMLPSPFKTHKGAATEHLVITAAGLAKLN